LLGETMSDNHIITWDEGNQQSKKDAFEEFSGSLEAYEGVSKASRYHRDFIDVEPNRSVRPAFTYQDYYAFRPEEQVPTKQKRIIKMCMDAYDKVGIIRNIIDLMGDFGCQGINIVHENESVEKFFKQWFKKIDGKERSERFLNNLYRTGQTIVYRSNANITPDITKYIKSMASDITVQLPEIERNQIPWRYNFFNPLNIDMKNGNINMFLGVRNYEIDSGAFLDNFKEGSVPAHVLDTLPPNVKQAIKVGQKKIDLEKDRLSIFYYKKDDWQRWANPLVYAILDDIVMLEKMRLADMSALDGAISNIRLWTLGNLDHKILPNKAAINKLRNVLASNTGGGTMELVWGPELSYTESNSQVYKFLGSEKYTSVLNSIYAGLGVPPTLTGMANNGGGFTNNFISLKTLVERLQYGRDQLTKFWERELELVRKAMGFRKPAHVVYDQMSLSDESAEKNLLIQLADRDIISHETVLERFKEVPSVEKMRLRREDKARTSDKLPEKASPFHNPQKGFEIEKMDKQAEINEKVAERKEQSKPVNPNGRPPNKLDEGPRKQRVDTPRSTPGVAELILWSATAYDTISENFNKAFLAINKKKNMRSLTKAQVSDLEKVKLDMLLNVEPLSNITEDKFKEVLHANKKMPNTFGNYLQKNKISTEYMTMEEYKRSALAAYVDYVLAQK
tara:strand:+ start:1510 stop:3543 length:2034 start_codon:yes stop_codon:yes gene_type:complete